MINTPGPWDFRPSLDTGAGTFEVSKVNAKGKIVLAWVQGDDLAHNGGCPIPWEMSRCNAALMAAAPDLLAACKTLVGLITTIREEQVSEQMRFGATDREKRERAQVYAAAICRAALKIEDATMQADAAISKAEGGGT